MSDATQFPTEAFPPSIQQVVRASAALNRVPDGLPAMCCLGGLSASLGRNLRIKSGPNRFTRPNLYILGSLGSGMGKSEVIRALMAPIYEVQRGVKEDFERNDKPGLLAQKTTIEARMNYLEKLSSSGKVVPDPSELPRLFADLQGVEKKLQPRQLVCEDTTPEALGIVLANNNETQFSVSADAREAVAVLQGRYSRGNSHDGLYVKCYSGDPHTVNRVSREPIDLQAPCLSLLWLLQLDKFHQLYGNSELAESGLLPRIMPACFDFALQKINANVDEALLGAAFKEWNSLITGLSKAYRCSSSEEEFTIFPDRAAEKLLVADYNQNVDLAQTHHGDISSFVARWTEWTWRIAVCVHAALHGADAHKHPLTMSTAMMAIRIRDFFKSQQLEILESGRVIAKSQLEQKVLALLADNVEGITSSDLYRSRIVPNAAAAHQLLKEMEAAGKLVGEDRIPSGGGKPSRIYRYNAQSSNPVPD